MKESMAAIHDPSISLENKLIAFDNFEQLVENIDNANNLSSLGLWTPLLEQLKSPESELRRMAAWCTGTSVQNNEKAQERVCCSYDVMGKILTFYSFWPSMESLLLLLWLPKTRTAR
jgi:hypothetical protein